VALEVAAGEHIVLLGRTGCGKSTLLQLLTRAWDADGGKILLNSQPLQAHHKARLRLFSKTLRENLLFAAPSAT